MPEDFDINKAVVEFVDRRFDDIYETLKHKLGTLTTVVRLKFRSTFHTYLKSSLERQSKSRSFFFSDEPQPLSKFYIPIGIRTDTVVIASANAKNLFHRSPYSVITGLGGCGKSVLLKHLFVDAILLKEKIPVIVELRNLNNSHSGLEDLIYKALSQDGFLLDKEAFREGLKKGLFAIMCDGFDEIDGALRQKISSEINDLTKADYKLWVVVTSRPDHQFNGWQNFTIYHAEPLSLTKAVELVHMTPVNEDLKSRFTQVLKQTLYAKHSSFLSNPLLLSIMLLAYRDTADIPNRLSIFYNLAYISLFHKHDALKGSFKRERKSGLDLDDFAKVFGAFSTITYNRRFFSFDRSLANRIISQAATLSGVNVTTEAFLHDATQAICLLVEDGLTIAFSHRSFQEYFTAKFISQAPTDMKKQLATAFIADLSRDNVIGLLHEMQPEFVETEIILPIISESLKEIKLTRVPISRAQHLRYLKTYFDTLHVTDNGENGYGLSVTLNEGMMRKFNMIQFVVSRCHQRTKAQGPSIADNEKLQNALKQVYEHGRFLKFAAVDIKNPAIEVLFDSEGFLSGSILKHLVEIVRNLKVEKKRLVAPVAKLLKIT